MTTGRGRYAFDDVRQETLLLVEGLDDARFFDAFLRYTGKSGYQIASANGRGNFRTFLRETLRGSPNFRRLRSIAVIRDADESAASAFQSVQDAIDRAGFPAPPQAFSSAQSGTLKVSVAILPDGQQPGALEDLCLRSVAQHPAIHCVDEYLSCLEASGISTEQSGKSRLHAFLSAGADPGLRIGEAADAGVWDWDSDAFRQLGEFLEGV